MGRSLEYIKESKWALFLTGNSIEETCLIDQTCSQTVSWGNENQREQMNALGCVFKGGNTQL